MKTKEYTYELISNISGVEIIDEPQNTNGISNIIKLIGATYNKVSKLSKETEIKFGDYDIFIERESNKISALENSKVSFVVQDGKVTFTQNDITAEVVTFKIYDNIKNILFGDGNIEVENYPKKNIIGSIHNRLDTIEKLKDNIKDINNATVEVNNLKNQPILSATVEQFDNIENILAINEDNLSISNNNNNNYNSLMKTNDIISFVKNISNKILNKIKSNKDNIDKNQKFLQGREDYYKCCALLGVDDIVYNTNSNLSLEEKNYWLENGRDKNILFRKGKKYYQIEHNRNYGDPYYYYWCIINNKDTCFNPYKTKFKKYNIGDDEYCEVTYYYNIRSSDKSKFVENLPQISLNFFIKKESIQESDLDTTEILNCIPNSEYFTTSNNNDIKKFPNVKYKENGINYIISNEKENNNSTSDITYKSKQLYDIEPTYNIIPSLESITLFYRNSNGSNQLINSHDFRFYITIYKNNELYPLQHGEDFKNSFKVGDSGGNEKSFKDYFSILTQENSERVNFYSFQPKILEKTYITYEAKIDGKTFKKTILINKIELNTN